MYFRQTITIFNECVFVFATKKKHNKHILHDSFGSHNIKNAHISSKQF
jgi:hypothetical protein